MKFITDILTGLDGKTYDIGRLSAIMGVVSFILFSGWAIWRGKEFDWIAYGTGYGAIMAASGLGLMLKKDTEPK